MKIVWFISEHPTQVYKNLEIFHIYFAYVFFQLILSLIYILVKAYKSQVSIQSANSVMQKPSDLSCLIPYIKNGRILRNEHSIMYNTPHKNKNTTEPVVKSDISLRNLSSIRQHLFSRDDFKVNTNIDISEESMDLTGTIYLKESFTDRNYDYIRNYFFSCLRENYFFIFIGICDIFILQILKSTECVF